MQVDGKPVVGHAHMGRKFGFQFGVIEFVADMGEESLSGLEPVDNVERLRNAQVPRVGPAAQAAQNQRVEILQQGPDWIGEFPSHPCSRRGS